MTAAGFVNAQTTKPVPKPVNILKTANDSVSYVLGEIAAFNLVQQGLGDVKLNSTVFLKAVNDIMGKKKPLIDDAAANACLTSYMTKSQTEKTKPTIEEGKKFLAQNKLKPGVKTTATGLQYEVIREGTGIKPTALDTFVAHYRGTLLNGLEFDASYNRSEPLTYPVNKVIPGWTEGLQLMAVGSKYKFYIPYNLGYGVMGQGQQIPGGALLLFELELLDVKKKQ
ncbi:MAG: FKBP-type peptidyl-prolyl cis-trans isomerase [Ferruginibacter sp.]|nr:FKBP-type peptidyl-prolyl cis-trans isomerase [Chitinophagaceae bacterium]